MCVVTSSYTSPRCALSGGPKVGLFCFSIVLVWQPIRENKIFDVVLLHPLLRHFSSSSAVSQSRTNANEHPHTLSETHKHRHNHRGETSKKAPMNLIKGRLLVVACMVLGNRCTLCRRRQKHLFAIWLEVLVLQSLHTRR